MDLYPELDPRVVSDPLITFITADSGTAETAYKLQSLLPQNRGKLFMILDSDHSAAHVRKELQVLVPLLKTGDYLLVEDTVINGHPVRPDSGPGPMEAIRDYIKTNPGVLIPDLAREEKFGATFAPEGYYVKG